MDPSDKEAMIIPREIFNDLVSITDVASRVNIPPLERGWCRS